MEKEIMRRKLAEEVAKKSEEEKEQVHQDDRIKSLFFANMF